MKVKEESENIGLKLNIQKTKIMAFGPITSWQIDGETVETVTRLYFLGLQNHCRWCCSHEMKRLWCWEGLGAGEGADQGWDGWMASRTRWTWVWVNSRRWRWTGRPGVLRSMGSQRVGHDWATELNCTVSTVSPSICHEVMRPDAMILVFWMLSFKPPFSLSSFTFIKRLFSSSPLSAIRWPVGYGNSLDGTEVLGRENFAHGKRQKQQRCCKCSCIVVLVSG